MSQVSDIRPLAVWLLTDNKPGHYSQLHGLGRRLEALAGARLVWIDQKKHPTPLWRAVLGLGDSLPYPEPNIIVAAGTGTHRLLFSQRRHPTAMTVILMRPSLPVGWLDAAIIPAHDSPPERSGILPTQGVINSITPLATRTSEHRGLILLGGPSKHFAWNHESIYEQISILSEQYPDWTWDMSSSRRTPEAFSQRLLKSSFHNVQFHHHKDTGTEWLAEIMARARVTWVSPDSVSMVYEALTAGIPTGLLALEPVRSSRVARGIVELERDGKVAPWTDRVALMNADPHHLTPLWEADRAARWVIHRYRQKYP